MSCMQRKAKSLGLQEQALLGSVKIGHVGRASLRRSGGFGGPSGLWGSGGGLGDCDGFHRLSDCLHRRRLGTAAEGKQECYSSQNRQIRLHNQARKVVLSGSS